MSSLTDERQVAQYRPDLPALRAKPHYELSVAVRPPSISASSTMGGATLLGTCLTGLQGLRGPLGWEPAEAAGTNNVVSKAAGVDIAYREPGSRLPRRRYEDMTKAPRERASRLPRSRLRRQFDDAT